MLIKLFRQHCQWSWRRRPLPCLQAAASTASTSSSSRPPRFYCKESLLRGKPGGSTAVEGDELKHLRVLRLKEGDLVELCDGLGNTVECSIVAIDRNRAWVQALQEPQRHPWRGPQWVLAVAW